MGLAVRGLERSVTFYRMLFGHGGFVLRASGSSTGRRGQYSSGNKQQVEAR